MGRFGSLGRVAVMIALGMWLGVSAARASIVKPAAAIHTASARHHVAHRHHRHAQAASLSENRLAPRPSQTTPPPTPARPRSHHKATLPSLVHDTRHAHGSKAGARHAAVPAASGALLSHAACALDARQNVRPDAREHPVTSGRGPPRGSPITPFGDRPSPAFVSASAPAASALAFDAHPGASASSDSPARPSAHSDRPHCAFPSRRRSGTAVLRCVLSPRSAPGRLRAVRREGATARFIMPSNGGSPCLA
jgi:hypothetical protein